MSQDVKKFVKGSAHVGIPSSNVKKTKAFLIDLGFRVESEEVQPNGCPVIFMEAGNVTFEIYEAKAPQTVGAIDHIALETSDIYLLYQALEKKGYQAIEGKICNLEFHSRQVRYFTIMGPGQEKIEFCQSIEREEE